MLLVIHIKYCSEILELLVGFDVLPIIELFIVYHKVSLLQMNQKKDSLPYY